jgi:hypothetical protein
MAPADLLTAVPPNPGVEISRATTDLIWLPLGAGGHSVRLNGRIYEALAAQIGRRSRLQLYHSALEIAAPEGRFVIEMAPIPDGNGEGRGVVAEGAVGSRRARRLRIFRYEVRRWRGGSIPDRNEGVDSPQPLSDNLEQARRLLELVPQVPTPVWGRDELDAGEMWNSNSLIAWLLARAGFDTASITPPAGGRAPGWHAGLVVAHRPRPKVPALLPHAYPQSPATHSARALMAAGAAVGDSQPKVTADGKEKVMKRLFAYGGIAASVILVAFGAGAIAIGVNGYNEVRDEIAAQQITATPDAKELTDGKLLPGQAIKTGADAKAFADIMEHHALESTEGQRYAEMGRFLTPSGEPTSDEALAAKTPDGRPVENGLRNLWVTETALTTALNTAFFAERVALFSIVMGVALLLTGIGFFILTLGGALGYVALPKLGKKVSTASAAT